MRDLVTQLVRLASRPLTAPSCPSDGQELDLHFHGGASCLRCGHEFEIGRDGQVLPSEHSIEGFASQWPDVVPEGWARRAADEWSPFTETPASQLPSYYKWALPKDGRPFDMWQTDSYDGDPWHRHRGYDGLSNCESLGCLTVTPGEHPQVENYYGHMLSPERDQEIRRMVLDHYYNRPIDVETWQERY